MTKKEQIITLLNTHVVVPHQEVAAVSSNPKQMIAKLRHAGIPIWTVIAKGHKTVGYMRPIELEKHNAG